MRPWMIGMLLGILPVPLLPALPGVYLPLLLGVVGLCALCLPQWQARFCGGLATGCALALVQGHWLLQTRLPADCASRPLVIEGRVVSLPRVSQMRDGATRQRFEFAVRDISPARCSGPGRVLLSYYGTRQIIPGDSWRFDLTLKKPWGLANPGSFNMQAWFAQSGIDAVGSVSAGRARHLSQAGGLPGWHHRLRLSISERIERLPLAADVRAVLRAVTVADKSGIDSSLWSMLQQFGVNHLLVISGLHIGLVAGAAYLLGGIGFRILLAAGISAAWLPGMLALASSSCYAALAGFSLSTQRALCMVLCFILAGLTGRTTASANNLLAAAVVVLALNPLAQLGSGLWLSFGSVAILLWLVYWQRGYGRWRRLLGTHVVMSLVMLPMGAWWFGGSSLVAAPANMLMVPLVGLVVVPLALLGVISIYLAPALEPLLWQLAGWPLAQVLPLARTLGADGTGRLYQPLAAGLPEVLLAALGVVLLILPAGTAVRLLAGALLLPLLLPPQPAPASGMTSVTVLDVGQGTALLVQAGSRTLLYDTGGGDPAGVNMATAVILPYLRRQGIAQLDTLLVSHPDADHSAGAAALLRALPVKRFIYGGKSALASAGRPCIAGQAWRWPTGERFQILSPARESGLSSNNSSCVLQLETGSQRLLIAGDIESVRERAMVRYWGDELRSDWLLLAHHGSRTSSSHAWLKTVRPAIAVISSGYGNRFGHPHADVLQRTLARGTRVYSTARGGALRFDFWPAQPVVVHQYRRLVRRFWM